MIELFNQQQALQRKILLFLHTGTIQNDHFLADLQTYDGRGDKTFLQWISWVEKVAKLTQCPEIEFVQEKQKILYINLLMICLPHQLRML